MDLDLEQYRVTPGHDFKLASISPDDTGGIQKSDRSKDAFNATLREIWDLQERLYAEGEQALLLVLQAMDTAGKDSTIRKVASGINPQGCRVYSFKVPSANELARDFLWRVHAQVPRKGHIGIFNRSHYEDVLVVRVKGLAPIEVVDKRYEQINEFEQLLHETGTRVIKIMLHISKEYQRERLLRRLRREDKLWKFNPGDLKERARWDDYMEAYEIMLNRCSTEAAPWYVVPAENRWYRNLVIGGLIRDTLTEMNPELPDLDFDPADYPPESIV
ncbi:MAG: polyphosphate kinase 2 family protein [Rhodothermia bacterium]|nr:polyphosphate kinase 2 family protein [Rhodothermia bacterium]